MTTPAAEQLDDTEVFRRLHKAAGLVLAWAVDGDPVEFGAQLISTMSGEPIDQVRQMDLLSLTVRTGQIIGLVKAECVRLGLATTAEIDKAAPSIDLPIAAPSGTPLH